MDVEVMAEMIAAAGRRPRPTVEDRRWAAWAGGPPEASAPVDGLPGATAQVNAARRDLENDNARTVLLAIAGSYIRAAIPDAAQTAGKHWMVHVRGPGSGDPDDSGEAGPGTLVRVTVGKPHVFWARLTDDDVRVWLRPAALPIREALDAGQLTAQELSDHGIVETPETLKTLADDAICLLCPTIDAAGWLLEQPAVLTAARLMNAMLIATNTFGLHAKNYRRDLVVHAWAAAQAGDAPDHGHANGSDGASRGADRGFDRPYSGRPAEADYQETMPTSPEARARALDEHDRLCRLLINHLAERGTAAGELIAPPVDLAWRDLDGTQYIAEIKSCLGADDATQLRLALGQILDYRHRLAVERRPRTVLLVYRVLDPAWHQICAAVDVRLLNGADSSTWRLGPTADDA